MYTFPDKKTKIVFGATCGVFCMVLAGVSYISYNKGYAKGSGDITTRPLTAHLTNLSTTGDLSGMLQDAGPAVDFGAFWKTWNILDKNFTPSGTSTAGTSTDEKRVLGAIDGLVRSYNDPYTVFIPTEQAKAFKESVNGEFEGIGAVLQVINGELTVMGLLPDSPAMKAGIKPGSRIAAVDGTPTINRDLNEVIQHIRGPKGSVVKLSVLPPKSNALADIEVTRGTVVIPTTATRVVAASKSILASFAAKAAAAAASVPGMHKSETELKKEAEEKAKQQKFFVLLLASFAKSSTDAFIKDLQEFSKSKSPYLIIDLRNNPGGYIDVAVDLASYFLPKDALIVTEKQGAQAAIQEHKSKGYDMFKDTATSSRRIVVLINKNSASASEILAGALQDYHMAKVVGETSFGKGSAQALVDVGTLGTLKITIARWYTPSGRTISHQGITPDVIVDVKDPKYASSTDPFMDAATEVLLDDTYWTATRTAH